MIDTHCHLSYEPLLAQIDAVMQRARAAGVQRMISVGTTPADARQVLALAQRYNEVFAAVGLHPHYAGDWRDTAALQAELRQLIAQPKVVAVGEMGMDRHYPEPPIELQRHALEAQLQVAAETDLPVIIHNRKATDDVLPILRDSGIAPARFVFHCFTGSDAELDAILAFGAMVSFTGIVTFKNSRELAASAARVPLERMMIETDSPYLTPEPHRKVKVNEPGFVPAVARFLAQGRGMSEEDFVAAVDGNARRFFAKMR